MIELYRLFKCVDGQLLYILRKNKNSLSWGEKNGTKEGGHGDGKGLQQFNKITNALLAAIVFENLFYIVFFIHLLSFHRNYCTIIDKIYLREEVEKWLFLNVKCAVES